MKEKNPLPTLNYPNRGENMGPRGVAWPLGPCMVICVMDVWIIMLRLVSDMPGGRAEESGRHWALKGSWPRQQGYKL